MTGSKSFEQAQVCAGGVHTDEIDPKTMESRLVPNIYFAGEVVDIDGMCGGYNLQWAWSVAMWRAYMRQDHTEHISVSGARKNDRGMKLQKCRKIRKKNDTS